MMVWLGLLVLLRISLFVWALSNLLIAASAGKHLLWLLRLHLVRCGGHVGYERLGCGVEGRRSTVKQCRLLLVACVCGCGKWIVRVLLGGWWRCVRGKVLIPKLGGGCEVMHALNLLLGLWLVDLVTQCLWWEGGSVVFLSIKFKT